MKMVLKRSMTSDQRLALLGADLYQMFCHYYEAKNLGPLGNDVADDLSPFAVGVHRPECHDPRSARDQQK